MLRLQGTAFSLMERDRLGLYVQLDPAQGRFLAAANRPIQYVMITLLIRVRLLLSQFVLVSAAQGGILVEDEYTHA